MNSKRGVGTSSNSKELTTPAVVIGCSHNNPDCNHEIHSSRDDFFTIDINGDLNPDLRLDIIQDEIPESLNNRFKLTILECLPYHAYNHDELYAQLTGFSGQRGLDNIRKMTDENGLIMIVGSSSNYRFRRSLASLKYLEIAENDEGGSVLLVPNNQTLSVDEVQKQVDDLPGPLKASIEKARTRDRPLRPTEFCQFNYQESDRNKALIVALDKYVSARMLGEKYTRRLNLLGTSINFGYSMNEKVDAADALMHVLLGNKPLDSLTPHQGPLSNGVLGRIVKNHLHGQPIQHFIQSSTKTYAQSHNPVSDAPTLNAAQIKPKIEPPTDDKFKKLHLLNRYSKKPSTEEEDEQERQRLSHLVNRGVNPFISDDELKELANNGEKFFIPPTSSDEWRLSCGDGHFYKGTLVAIHDQVQADLNEDTENAKLMDGFARINRELLAKPNLACPKPNPSGSRGTATQEQDLTSRSTIRTQTKY
ncbi:hypothetical protein [Legionella waltersii]|uniref:Uncharacterized protein n=1 Tax=Legionella waltersii TaxID=66969 RepID=A0A0W1AP83_9GAMM|nr:hypothetical protein [Legionella waltersii]KTD83056.1 hypothetical protein Lwal_0092 [Legionella waltersii]SNU97578.1 Uncharacterised protein [Legionella waltersii]